MISNSSSRLIYADAIRFLAITAVVILHVSAYWLYLANFVSPSWWLFGNLVDSLFRWGMPVFVMLSGLLLLDPNKEENLGSFFKKRVFKVVIPLVFWTIVYLDWRFLIRDEHFTLLKILRILVDGSAYFHFGFLYVILGLYLCVPIMRIFIKYARQKDILYFISVWFLYITFSTILYKFWQVNLRLAPEMFIGFLGYFVLGYYLRNFTIQPKYLWIIFLIGILSIFVTCVGTYFLTRGQQGILDEFFYGYLTPNVIIMSFCVFYLLKQINYQKLFGRFLKMPQYLEALSLSAFGVFLIHPIILDVFFPDRIKPMLSSPFWAVPLVVAIALVLSFAITFLIRKIPYLKNVVP